MPINVQGYFNALRSYLNTTYYEVTEVDNKRIVLKDKIYPVNSPLPVEQRVRLVVPSEALVIHLDKKQPRTNSSLPLFHFLDDTAKPWSRRCDFVVFHHYRNRLSAICIEFKSATLPEGLVDQLKAGEAWCRVLHSIVKLYTTKTKRLHLTKYVLSCHPNPTPYLDPAGRYLQRDPSIRHYLYDDIDGMSLDALDNTNIESIN